MYVKRQEVAERMSIQSILVPAKDELTKHASHQTWHTCFSKCNKEDYLSDEAEYGTLSACQEISGSQETQCTHLPE
jgi:hypothetical protein